MCISNIFEYSKIMKRKTDFKKMYLVDTTLYNTLGNQQLECNRPNTIVLKENVSHPTFTQPTIKIGREFVENSSTEQVAPTQTQTRSIGTMIKLPTESKMTQSDAIQTNSSGMMTEPVHIQSHLGTQDRTLEYRALQPLDRTLQPMDRTPRMQYNDINDTPTLKYRTPRVEYRAPRVNYRAPRSEYRAPRVEYHKTRQPALQQTPSQQNIPHTIQPFASSQLQNNTLEIMDYDIYDSQIPQQRDQLQIMDTNAPLTQPMMDYNTSTPLLALQAQPTESPPQPQIMDYTTGKLAIETPSVSGDCDDCAVTEYKKYDTVVALPSAQGLPDNVLFTCTLCNSDFKTKRTLERHLNNQHEAFSQIEKGAKRKTTEEENPNHPKKIKSNEKRKAAIMYTSYF